MNHTNYPNRRKQHPNALLYAALVLATPLWAQQAAPAGASASSKEEDEVLTLSAFEVSANSDVGYQTNETLAGGRFRTSYKDVSSQVNVMTPELISDLAIGTLDEAFRFSLNIERENDFYNVQSGSNQYTSNPFGGNNSRTRGLGKSTTTHDFFETYLPVDTYNTEKITFVSGPNAILFGNGQAGGSIEMGLLRPDLLRAKTKVETRYTTGTNGYRASFDHSQPIVKKKLGIRIAMLRGDEDAKARPSAAITNRQYASIIVQPLPSLKIFAYGENVHIDRTPTRPILIQDKITPYLNSLANKDKWLATGDTSNLLGFDNSKINSTASTANTTALNAAMVAQGLGTLKTSTVLGNFSATSGTNPMAILDLGGVGSATNPMQSWGNTLRSEGPEQYYSSAENVYDWSLTDSNLYPRWANVSGNSAQSKMKGQIRGVIAEFSPVENLTLEFGVNTENARVPFVQWLPYAKAELHLDINKYLPSTWTGSTVPTRVANPNYGRYYLDTTGGDSTFGETINQKQDSRTTALYHLDLTKRKDWLRHLGSHNFTLGYTTQMNRSIQATNGDEMRITSNNVFTTETAATQILNTNRRFSMRYYIDNPSSTTNGNYVVKLPFDPWTGGTVGYDTAGNAVQVGTFDVPGTPGTSTSVRNTGSGTKKSKSVVAAMNNSFLDNHLVTTFGYREDNNKLTLWALPARQPRWDALNNTWYYPNASEALPSRLTNAPYMKWQDLMNAPDYNRIDRTNEEKGVKSKLGGFVVHATKWLSLYYNSSSSKFATDYARKNLDGSVPQLEDGQGYDTGVMFDLLENRLSLRFNYYKTTKTGTASAFRDVANGAPGVRPIRDLMAYVERSYYQATGKSADTGFKYYPYIYDIDLANNYTVPTLTGTSNPGSYGGARDDYDLLSNMVAKGLEMTLTANLTSNWRLSVTGAKNDTTESNIGPQYFDFFKQRVKDYETVPNASILGSGWTMTNFMQTFLLPQLNFVYANQGFPNNVARKYRVTGTTRYEFNSGFMKGFFIGGSGLYRSKAGIGFNYRKATADDIKFDYLNVAANSNTYQVPDLTNPIYSPIQLALDGFAGYERKIYKGKVNWRIQMNIQNLLQNRDLTPMRAQMINNAAYYTSYALSEPRTVMVTNTFEF
jgi:hypothetical protein